MTTTRTDIESQRTVHYIPQTMSFREYDKKMLNFRPQFKWWKLVIEEGNMWDQQTGAGINIADKWTAAKQEEQKNSDHIAMVAYIPRNTGESDAYTNCNSAFVIREALLKKYDGEELTDLAVLHKKYDNIIPSKKKEYPIS
jgi:hypothetical protein